MNLILVAKASSGEPPGRDAHGVRECCTQVQVVAAGRELWGDLFDEQEVARKVRRVCVLRDVVAERQQVRSFVNRPVRKRWEPCQEQIIGKEATRQESLHIVWRTDLLPIKGTPDASLFCDK